MRTYKLFCWLLPLFLLSVFFILLFFVIEWILLITNNNIHDCVWFYDVDLKQKKKIKLTSPSSHCIRWLHSLLLSTPLQDQHSCLHSITSACDIKKKDMIKIYSSVRVHDFKKTLIFVCVHFLNHFLKILQFIKNISLFMSAKWWLPSDTVIWIYHLN